MRVFLAGTHSRSPDILPRVLEIPYVLESFYYIQDWQVEQIKRCKMFLLDSGAYTFMANDVTRDFNLYLKDYIKYIKQNGVKYFFELDIDNVVGYEKVKEMRQVLEQNTGRQCIPVWHKSRGLEDFIRMTEDYNYAAIGGLVTREIKQSEYPYITELLKIARQNNCEIHGLGFTKTNLLTKYRFASVDSTSWLQGARFGNIVKFDGKKIIKVPTPAGKKTVHYLKVDDVMLKEWIKFANYAEKRL